MLAPVAAFLVGLPAVKAAQLLARRVGFVDRPAGRKAHQRPVPYGGGVAIVFVLLLAPGLGLALVALRNWPPIAHLPFAAALELHAGGIGERLGELALLAIATLIIFFMGLADDRLRLPAWPKLLAQLAAAAIFVYGLGRFATFFVPLPFVNQLATVLWIVAVTNAFNFMDNMDGLSAGVAVIVLGVLAAVAISAGQLFVPVLALVLLGALAAFLVFNFPPASIFLGDAGSQTVGYLVAVLTVMANYYRPGSDDSMFSPFMPLVLLAVPLYDLVSVTVIRLCRGQSPFVGDTSHFSHRLAALGLSRRSAVLVIYLATLTTAAGAWLLRRASAGDAVLIFIQTLAIIAIIAIFERIAGERAAGR